MQIDLFAEHDATAYMNGPCYQQDSVGPQFDPEEMLKARRNGASVEEALGTGMGPTGRPAGAVAGAARPVSASADRGDCLICATDDAPEDHRVFRDDLWTAEVVPGYDVPGWFILRARQHPELLTGLDDAEARSLGPRRRQLRLTRCPRN